MALWLMAISMRIFGMNIIALRLPMVLLGTIAVYAVYRMARIMVNERYAYIAALFMGINSYLLYFTTGCVSTDHVDFSLFAFTTFSFWAWFEYRAGYTRRWLILIGLFAGFAALSKSLMGMLVFPAWLIALLANKEDRAVARNYIHLCIALAVAVVVWLPWQLWINYAFPQEAHYESQMVIRHLSESIERAKEPFWFYFTHLHNMYFDYAMYLVPIGFYLLYRRSRDKPQVIFLIAAVLITYIIFTLAVTKMEAYVIGCMAAIILALSTVVYALLQFLIGRSSRPILVTFVVLAALSALYLNVAHNTGVNTYLEKPDYYDGQERISRYYKKIAPEINGYVIFNVPYRSMPVPLMFFADATAYTQPLTEKEYAALKKHGYKIATYDSPDIPGVIKDDPAVKKLPIRLE
jgi:4-amino-4-deoxy-L-arabinose transferase-like glycosyltransferase